MDLNLKCTVCGFNALSSGIFYSVATFNQGNIMKCDVLRSVGAKTAKMLKDDKKRIKGAERFLLNILETSARQQRKSVTGKPC
jgi:hypothetical protein